MTNIKKIIFSIFFVLCFFVSNSRATDPSEGTLNDRIQCQTIVSYSQTLNVVGEVQKKHPKRRIIVLSDWDNTVVSVNGNDSRNLLRDIYTKVVIDALQKLGIPVIVVTARFHQEPATIEDYIDSANSMKNNTGISLQTFSANIDFRQTHDLPAVFCEGIVFTQDKGKAVVALIDHPDSPIKGDHYVFIDDKPDEIGNMRQAFNDRVERLTTLHLTTLHYPEQISPELHNEVCQKLTTPCERLSFSLRHGYQDTAGFLLDRWAKKYKRTLNEIHAYPFLMDSLMGNDEEAAASAHILFEYKFNLLNANEIMAILEHLTFYQREKTMKWFIKRLSHNEALVGAAFMSFLNSNFDVFYAMLEETPFAESLSNEILIKIASQDYFQPGFLERFETLLAWRTAKFPEVQNKSKPHNN